MVKDKKVVVENRKKTGDESNSSDDEQSKKQISKDEPKVLKSENTDQIEVETKKNEEKTSKLLAVTASEILDLISNIKIVVSSQKVYYIEGRNMPIEGLMNNNEILHHKIEQVRGRFNIWNDEPNRRRYFINDIRSLASEVNLVELFNMVIDNVQSILEQAFTYMHEPDRVTLVDRQCYNPDKLGYKMNELFVDSGLNDDCRRILQNECMGRRDRVYMVVNTLEDARVANTRIRVLRYMEGEMRNVLDLWNEILRTYCDVVRCNNLVLRVLDVWSLPIPFAPHNLVTSPFDCFTSRASFRVEMLGALTLPVVVLEPIPPTDLQKTSGSNPLKSTYITSLINQDYNSDMANAVSMYFASLMNPGDVLMDIDFDSYNPVAIELMGFVGMLCKAMFMFDFNSTFSNITYESMCQVDRAIIKMLMNRNMIQPRQGYNYEVGRAFPLDGYEMTRNVPGPGLEYLQTRGGINGMNCCLARAPNLPDRMLAYYDSIGVRINYAVDHSNFESYTNAMQPGNWYVSRAITNILSRHVSTAGYASIASVILSNIEKFFVRWNAYGASHWYSIFRQSARNQANSNYRTVEQFALRVSISVPCLMYLAKSLPIDELRPMIPNLDRLRFESAFCKEVEMTRVNLRAIQNLVGFLDYADQFGPKQLLKIVCRTGIMKHLLDVVSLCNEERELINLIEVRRRPAPFCGLFEDATVANARTLAYDGFVESVVFHPTLNRCSKQFIRRILRNNAYLNNFIAVDNPRLVTYEQLYRLITQQQIKETLFNSANRMISLSHIYPYSYNFAHDRVGESSPIVWRRDVNSGLKVREDVSFCSVKVNLVSISVEDYKHDDDYVPHFQVVESVFIPNEQIPRLVVSVEDVLRNLAAYRSSIYTFPIDSMKLESLF